MPNTHHTVVKLAYLNLPTERCSARLRTSPMTTCAGRRVWSSVLQHQLHSVPPPVGRLAKHENCPGYMNLPRATQGGGLEIIMCILMMHSLHHYLRVLV